MLAVNGPRAALAAGVPLAVAVALAVGACELLGPRHVRLNCGVQLVTAATTGSAVTPAIATACTCCWVALHWPGSALSCAVTCQLTHWPGQCWTGHYWLRPRHAATSAQSSTWPPSTASSCDLAMGRLIFPTYFQFSCSRYIDCFK